MLDKTFYKKKLDNASFYNVVTLNEMTKPITVLLGPNGTGKSMTLRTIKEVLEKKKQQYLTYTTSKDDIVQKGAPVCGDWDPWKLAQAFTSEGERMTSSFFDFVNTDFLRAVLTNNKPLTVLIDEADSGLSLDRLYETLTQLLFVVTEEIKKNRDIHIIITCNSYEMYEILNKYDAEFIWIPTGKRICFNTYEGFKKPYMEYYKNVHEVLLNREEED